MNAAVMVEDTESSKVQAGRHEISLVMAHIKHTTPFDFHALSATTHFQVHQDILNIFAPSTAVTHTATVIQDIPGTSLASYSDEDMDSNQSKPGCSRHTHPILTGTPCNKHGDNLPPQTPPPPHPSAPYGEWSPFTNRTEFETAEFLFKKNQMSQGDINTLMDLWAATLLKHGDTPPFSNYQDMDKVIDSIPLGVVLPRLRLPAGCQPLAMVRFT